MQTRDLGITPDFPLRTTITPLTGQGKLEPRTSTIQEMTQWEKDPERSLLPSCPVTVTSPPPAVMVSCFPAALTSRSSISGLYLEKRPEDHHTLPKKPQSWCAPDHLLS